MSVLDAIGETPLIRLTRVVEGIAAAVYLKAEFLNPGGSVKDRAALAMVRAAEASGELRPGGVIVEGTSGNTGIGLAMVAAQGGYRAVVVVPDKSSGEKPEIWRQTGGRVTHFVAGIGTGGTISGAGAYLRDTGGVTIVGADPENSVYGGGDGSPYYVESIGHYVHPDTTEDVWPRSYHPEVVDRVERVGDRESIEMTRRLARAEGILVGASTGTAVVAALRVARELGPDGVVVVLAPDSGRAYLSKYFEDGWLRRAGFPAPAAPGPLVGDGSVVTPVFRYASATVADLTAVAPPTGVALLVLPRRDGASVAPAPGDIVGVVPLEATAGAAPGTPLTDLARSVLPTVGAGETVAEALARTPEDAPWLAVLTDGRVTGVVARADLMSGID